MLAVNDADIGGCGGSSNKGKEIMTAQEMLEAGLFSLQMGSRPGYANTRVAGATLESHVVGSYDMQG